MGILYIIYRGDVSRRFVKDLCQRSVCKTWSISENYIGLRPEICIGILGVLYSKTKNTNSNINNILSIDRWINKTIELDVRAVFILLYQSRIEQLGIVVTSYIVCI